MAEVQVSLVVKLTLTIDGTDLVADRGQGEIYLFSDAGNAPLAIFASGFDQPTGLYFEDPNTLLVTDDNLNALFRISGDFCAL